MQDNRIARDIVANEQQFQTFILQRKTHVEVYQLIKSLDASLRAALDYEDMGLTKGYIGYKYKEAYDSLFKVGIQNNFKFADDKFKAFDNYPSLKTVVKSVFKLYEIIWEQYKYLALAQTGKVNPPDQKETVEFKLSPLEQEGQALYEHIEAYRTAKKIVEDQMESELKKGEALSAKIKKFAEDAKLDVVFEVKSKFETDYKTPAIRKINEFKAIEAEIIAAEKFLGQQQKLLSSLHKGRRLSPPEIRQNLAILQATVIDLKEIKFDASMELKQVMTWKMPVEFKSIKDEQELAAEINKDIKEYLTAKQALYNFQSEGPQSRMSKLQKAYGDWLHAIHDKIEIFKTVIENHQKVIGDLIVKKKSFVAKVKGNNKLSGEPWNNFRDVLEKIINIMGVNSKTDKDSEEIINESAGAIFSATSKSASQSMNLKVDLTKNELTLSDQQIAQMKTIQEDFDKAHKEFEANRNRAIEQCNSLETILSKEKSNLEVQLKAIPGAMASLKERRDKIKKQKEEAIEKLLRQQKQYEEEAKKQDALAVGLMTAKIFSGKSKEVKVANKQQFEELIDSMIKKRQEVGGKTRKIDPAKRHELTPGETLELSNYADIRVLEQFKQLVAERKLSYRDCWNQAQKIFPLAHKYGMDEIQVVIQNCSPAIKSFFENILNQVEPIPPAFLKLKELFYGKFPQQMIDESKNLPLKNIRNLFIDGYPVPVIAGALIELQKKVEQTTKEKFQHIINGLISFLEKNENLPKDKEFQAKMKENWVLQYKTVDMQSQKASPR